MKTRKAIKTAKRYGLPIPKRKERKRPSNESYVIFTNQNQNNLEFYFGKISTHGDLEILKQDLFSSNNTLLNGLDNPNPLKFEFTRFENYNQITGSKRNIIKFLHELNIYVNGSLMDIITSLKPKKIEKNLNTIEGRVYPHFNKGDPLCVYNPNEKTYVFGYYSSNGTPNQVSLENVIIASRNPEYEVVGGIKEKFNSSNGVDYYKVPKIQLTFSYRDEILLGDNILS
jgi:hypothetical protein